MLRPSRVLLTLVVLIAATGLAGCLDIVDQRDVEPRPDLPPEGTDDDPPPNSTNDPDPVPVRFAAAVSGPRTLWENGSFAPEQTGMGGGFVTGEFARTVDLSPLLPVGVPTRLEVNVTMDAEEITVVGPTSRVEPVGNGTQWYTSSWKHEPPHAHLIGVFKRSEDGSFVIRLEAYVPGPQDPPTVSYTMRASATAHAERVPPGVPVALALAGGETVAFKGPEPESRMELLVFAPDDTLADRLYFLGAHNWTAPAGTSGEYVILGVPGSGDLEIHKDPFPTQSPTMRALDLKRETGRPHEIASFEPTTWSFDMDDRPLRVMVGVTSAEGAPWLCTGAIVVRLDAPEEQLLERGVECPSPTNVPFLYQESWTWSALLGDDRLVPGTYTVNVEANLLHGFDAFHMVERYER